MSDATSMRADKPVGKRKRSLGVRVLRFALGLMALLVILACLGYYLLHRPPSWYVRPNLEDDKTLDLATKGQERIDHLYRGAQGQRTGKTVQPLEWSITQEQLNGYLAVNFPGGPGQAMRDPMVRFAPGQITLAARFPGVPGGGPEGGVASITLLVETLPGEADGPPLGRIRIGSVQAGSLPIPKGLVEQRIREHLPEWEPRIKAALTQNLGPKRADTLEPQIDAAIGKLLRGEPFPLAYKTGKQVMWISELAVGEGQVALKLVPGK